MNDLQFENDYKKIKEACLNKVNITFYAEKVNTLFSSEEAPTEWTKYPPSFGSQDEFESLRVRLSVNPQTHQYLTLLEFKAYELGAEIFYRYRGESHISIKFKFNDGADLKQ